MTILGSARRAFALLGSVAFASTLMVGCLDYRPVHADTLFRDNFNSGNAKRWQPTGGTWTVPVINGDGKYVGQGTSATPSPCGLVSNADTVIRGLRAADVELEADVRSIERVDKPIGFRWDGTDRQIVLGIRAERPGAFPADLMVLERINCQQIAYTSEFSVLIPPHQIGDTIHVHAILIGNRLRVLLDNVLVLDRAFPFSHRSGRVALEINEWRRDRLRQCKGAVWDHRSGRGWRAR